MKRIQHTMHAYNCGKGFSVNIQDGPKSKPIPNDKNRIKS